MDVEGKMLSFCGDRNGLTGEGGISASDVGKINVLDSYTYVAIVRASVAQALACLGGNKIKGRFYKVRKIC